MNPNDTTTASMELIRRLDADVRELRADLKDHTEAVEKRLDAIDRKLKNGNGNGNGPWWARYWKDVVIIALIAQAFGLNIAEAIGWIG